MLGFDSYTLELYCFSQDDWANNMQESVDKNTQVWEFGTVNINNITIHENITEILSEEAVYAVRTEEGWIGSLTELVQGWSYLFKCIQDQDQDTESYTWETGLPSPAAVPSSEKYWKNIIPSNYELSDRSGIYSDGDSLPYFMCEADPTTPCNGLDDEASCAYLGESGLSTFCVSADICQNQVCVDENDPQYWSGTNIYNQTYYYPVLPKITRYRTFDKYQLQNDNSTFFGSKGRWNANDKIAPITNNDFYDDVDFHNNKLVIDLNFEDIQSDAILDKIGGGYLGIFTGDYKIEFSKNYDFQEKKDWIGLPMKDTLSGGKQY